MDNPELDLPRLEDYGAKRTQVFPGLPSLQWYVRKHKPELIRAGALLLHCGRWHVHSGKFDEFVLKAAQEAAERQVTA